MTCELKTSPECTTTDRFIIPSSASESSWTYDAPTRWPRYRLKQLGLLNPPRSTLSAKLVNELVAFVPMARARAHDPRLRPEKRPFPEVAEGFTAFQNGDLLIAKITPCFENGKGGIAGGLANGIGFGSTEFHVFRPLERQCRA